MIFLLLSSETFEFLIEQYRPAGFGLYADFQGYWFAHGLFIK